ncbi:hypothetical protein ACFWJT_15670 [Streptomyces sp. NPDC127069]|uniref:hypothetical protein n=1 Tax=Streptomyces sp. NPDC127069 TaxID=3347128 RepID=UPI003664DC40
MTVRSRKPWRVTLAGETTEHTSEKAAYTHLIAALRSQESATDARVDKWEDGRWLWYETVEASELPPAQ